jgi:hypothetical protein
MRDNADRSTPMEIKMYCTRCGGEGRIYTSCYGGNDPNVRDAGECPACEGSGRQRDCPDCGAQIDPMLFPCLEQHCPARTAR